ncbi:cell growth regulator with RING finger domain protein 1-like [Homarus americanus]|uniref:Cell growth regulator with RING finger domain protein 1-like n=1 Tax=Homarus americanus TaxID=6706 RepID=A0A8J5JPT3_HOMAM|nr:cell growth regulator with RING finger domain protein 1-like [Homarus americanus]KAG7161836.1 Cell growth regulator with RING finger domain protein 1-like [Homarus americanus]
MVAVLTAALMTAAEISNLFSALGVLICFICMVIFIIRLQGEDLFGASVVHVAQPPVAQVEFQKVAVPFSLELHKPGDASFADIQLKIRSEVSYIMRSFWGVPSDHLHALLMSSWSGFFMHLIEKPSVKAEITDKVVSNDIDEETECVKHVGIRPIAPPLTLGMSPRKNYPLVVCIMRQDSLQQADANGVGALITIIHIKDSECQIPTCILHQYLKQYSGQLTKLQALYTQGNNGSQKSEDRNSDSSDEEVEVESKGTSNDINEEEAEVPLEEACVVCQTKKTTRALLPCRHVCVCDVCCGRLDNCPMCRARILAYFLVAPEDSLSVSEDETVEVLEPPSAWRRLNDTVTRMIGAEQQ